MFTIDVERPLERPLRFRLRGALDLGAQQAVHDAIAGAEVSAGATVVLDLTDVDFCDSTGLTTLLTTQEAVDAVGGRLLVAFPGQQLRRLLDLTGLEGHFAIVDGERPAASS
jgi:anti-anti-sigma factor